MLFRFRSHTCQKEKDVFTHVTNRYITENFHERAVTTGHLFGFEYLTFR